MLDKSGELPTDLTARRIDELFAEGTVSGGMLPKIAGVLDAAKCRTTNAPSIRLNHAIAAPPGGVTTRVWCSGA